MPAITFGALSEANEVRHLPAVERRLSASDDRRRRTVELESGTPERIVDRLESRALQSQRSASPSRGMAELTAEEREYLQRTHSTFSWRRHGFEAMRAKAALRAKGATEWLDFYEPGEGVPGALANLGASKKRSSRTGASIGVGGERTDEEELVDRGARGREVEQARAGAVSTAKDPALVEADPGAVSFLREEMEFGAEPFDIAFAGGSGYGPDYERLEERHEQRSERSQLQDESLHAPLTRDPLKWTENPDRWDYPGIDELDPELVHSRRSERARAIDEARSAPLASTAAEWAERPDELDLGGIDTPAAMSLEESGEEIFPEELIP